MLSRFTTQNRFIVLPPSRHALPGDFRQVERNTERYEELLAEMQRFRGSVYLADGAIQPSELVEGRHRVSIDHHSWHILSVDSQDSICACLRFRHLAGKNATCFDDLWVRYGLSRCPTLYQKFRAAVEVEMIRARELEMGFAEVGGWAVAKQHRWTSEPLRIILASCALGELLGGCAGVATATCRHGSASILKRIGLTTLQGEGAELPPYYDPRHGCQMEVLRFDTRFPNPKYSLPVRELSLALANSLAICRDRTWSGKPGVIHRTDRPVGAPALSATWRLLRPRRSPANLVRNDTTNLAEHLLTPGAVSARSGPWWPCR